MHSKSDNVEMINDKEDKVTEEIFFCRYQAGLETLMNGSNFIFHCAHLLYYKYHKINLKRGESYIDPPDWMKSKPAAINPINKNGDKCF